MQWPIGLGLAQLFVIFVKNLHAFALTGFGQLPNKSSQSFVAIRNYGWGHEKVAAGMSSRLDKCVTVLLTDLLDQRWKVTLSLWTL